MEAVDAYSAIVRAVNPDFQTKNSVTLKSVDIDLLLLQRLRLGSEFLATLITSDVYGSNMSAVSLAGVLAIIIGMVVWYHGTKSTGEMEIEIGKFKGPVWFLLVIFGLFLIVVDQMIALAYK